MQCILNAFPSSVFLSKQSTAPTYFPSMCLPMSFPGIFLGQYRRFLIKSPPYIPLASNSKPPFATQKPLPNTTEFPEPKIGLHIVIMSPTVLPSSWCCFAPLCDGQHFPSTIFFSKLLTSSHKIS